jgi:hypothetical protein
LKLVPMPESGIYRAGRWVDVEQFPPPAPPTATNRPLLDGYRWEDSAGEFSTVKCSGSAEAAIGRVFARYRARVFVDGSGIIDRMKRFFTAEPDPGDPELVAGEVPPDVFEDLYLVHIPGSAPVVFVDIHAPETQEALEAELGPALRALGAGTLSANLAREKDRRITRLVMRTLHTLCSTGRVGPVAGVRCAGQPDANWEAFILWAPPRLVALSGDTVGFRWVARWDDDAVAAATALDIKLPGSP